MPVHIPQPGRHFTSYRLRYVLASTWAGYAGYTMARRPFSVARSVIEQDVGISKYESGTVDTAFLLAYTVAQLFYGSLLKGRYSPKNILVCGLIGSALCCLLLASSSSGFAFAAAWAMNGCFQAAGWASCITILTPWLNSNERGRIMGLWGTNMAAGGIIGNVVTSMLIGAGYSWRSAVLIDAFALVGIAAFMALTLVGHPNLAGFVSSAQQAEGVAWRTLTQGGEGYFTVDGAFVNTGKPIDVNASSTSAASATNSSADNGSGQLSFLETLRIQGIASISLSYFFHKLVRYALMFWLPYYFSKELHYTTVQAGYVASALDVGGVAGSVLSGIVSDKYAGGHRRATVILFFAAGMALSTAFFVLLKSFIASSMVGSVTVSFLVGFFAFAIDSLMSGSYLQDYCERINVLPYMGAISGVVGGIATAGSIAQGYLTVAVSDASWDTLFGILALLTVFAGLLMWTPVKMELASHSVKK